MHKISFIIATVLVTVFAVLLPVHGAMATSKGLSGTITCECATAPGVCVQGQDKLGNPTCEKLKGNRCDGGCRWVNVKGGPKATAVRPGAVSGGTSSPATAK
jgi:hypothetical protein